MIIPDTSFQSKIDSGWSLELLMLYYQISDETINRMLHNLDNEAEDRLSLQDLGLHDPLEAKHVL